MRTLIFLLCAVFSTAAKAQDNLVPLKVSERVGYMIDRQENKDYGFFTQCPADSFLYAKLFRDTVADACSARLYYRSGSQRSIALGPEEMAAIREKATKTVVATARPGLSPEAQEELAGGLGRLLVLLVEGIFNK